VHLSPPGASPAAGAAGPESSSRDASSDDLLRLSDQFRVLSEEHLDLQAQLIRVEKLAGIGRLAAGVAHEIRNPLGAIATYAEVLRRRGVEPDIVDQVQTAVARIERTVQSLLDYARTSPSAGPADMKAGVQAVVAFLEAQGRFRQHALAVQYDEVVPPVRGDRHGLEQVVMNLLLNACDAGPGTRIWLGVQARRFEPSHRNARRRTDTTGGPPLDRQYHSRPRRPDVPPGTAGVFVYVADDGPGIADELRERVFDPFFTTKDPGEGTGLGLAIVARTVHDAGGLVWVDRAREGGAAFKIFLPAAAPAAGVVA
jgi:signal transduction histidine kinase